ncbi:hypothetical protein ACFQ0X_08170 [Streptomyces rectiviolaceus]|uniref:hypothetical protein n=1 Tax=Streptomyces rectiviolaceus TaxID=332591 RepID=UPI0036256107
MADSTLWVACLTAGTAIVASWVAGRGNMNAAKTQAITAAQADRAHASLQARRESYLEVVEQAHEMGALYRDIPEILATTPSDARRNAVQEHTKRLRAAYGPFTRAGDFMIVEGAT